MTLRYVYACLCIYIKVYICVSTAHTRTVGLTELQVFCLFCRTSVAGFVFFPTGKCKEQTKACIFTAGTFASELQVSGFVRGIIWISIKWSGNLAMSTFCTSNSHGCVLEIRVCGLSGAKKRRLCHLRCVSLPVQRSPIPLVSRNGSSLHFLFAVSCCRTRIFCPVTNGSGPACV